MVFKLIRVDEQEPSKILLHVGKHIIGRGKFLHNDDNDKRVSRNHAELEVTDDSVTLKALHRNPCFYTKSNIVETEILQQNNIISLSNGDKFGLIPDTFWYEVIHCSELDIPQNTAACTNESSKDENKVTSNLSSEDEAINFQMSEAQEDSNRTASPSLLNQEESNETNGENTVTYDPATASGSANKRANDTPDSNPVDVKKIKTEPPTQNVQDAQPGPSNDQAADPDSKDQKPNIDKPVSPPQPPAPNRERCMYGGRCYRRNPQHKAQFSHPSDSDWGTGERGVCPYGSACRKNDPRHWQAHEHPPGVNPPDPTVRRPGMQVVQRHGNVFYINAHSVNFYDDHFQVEDSDGDSQRRNRNRTSASDDNEDSSRVKRRRNRNSSESDEDSEDSPGTDLIVTGKRVRKTVQRDTWIDTQSDEDEDPYKTDESDEWQPSSDITNSEGFSQKF
ncbi:unnamed protein product [Arctia plantaginis]|uniref:Aprataxin and PNK-like factor n=1 Tax=Arctia plantaginis TaxID=874455 RepID=A0A8S1BRB3_ARCPL|nr:unnamed protein product [Arctia plantaginis]